MWVRVCVCVCVCVRACVRVICFTYFSFFFFVSFFPFFFVCLFGVRIIFRPFICSRVQWNHDDSNSFGTMEILVKSSQSTFILSKSSIILDMGSSSY